MTREHLNDLIAHGEGPTLEFKRSLTKDFGRELCAFANSDGGTLLIGISDHGRIVGVANHNRMKSRIQSIARSADPPIDVEIDAINEVLRVRIPGPASQALFIRRQVLQAGWTQQPANG